MKKGINESSGVPVPLRRDRMAEFKLLKEAGFNGIELEFEKAFSDEEIKAIQAAASATGVKVLSLVSPLLWKYPLTSNDEATREEGKGILKAMIKDAKTLGADTILCVPGVINGEVSYLQGYNNALKSLQELKPYIEEYGIYVGIENVWNKFLLTPLEMRDFIDKVDCKYVVSYFDAGNVLVNSYPHYWVEILGERIKKVHIKDFKLSIGNITGFVNLFEGDMDWGKLMESLRTIGYDDYVTVEVPTFKNFPEKFLYETADSLDKIFSL